MDGDIRVKKMSIRTKLGLVYVPRWVICPMLRHQSVAEHSWRVAVIADELSKRLGLGAFQLYSVYAAVGHDLVEALTGDIPATVKPQAPINPNTETVDLVVKVADFIEAKTWFMMWGRGPSWDVLESIRVAMAPWVHALSVRSGVPKADEVVDRLCREIENG